MPDRITKLDVEVDIDIQFEKTDEDFLLDGVISVTKRGTTVEAYFEVSRIDGEVNYDYDFELQSLGFQ